MAAVASLPMGPDRLNVSLRNRLEYLSASKKRLLKSNGTEEPELRGTMAGGEQAGLLHFS